MYEVVMEMVDKMGYEVKSLMLLPLIVLFFFFNTNSYIMKKVTNFPCRLGLLELPQEFTRRITRSYSFQRFATSGLQNASSI